MSITNISKLHVTKFAKSNNAPVLALLHGWGSSSKIWQACIAQLADDFNVWCIDLPGHGKSSAIEWDESIEQGIGLLARTLPEESILIGWSLGGLLAQLFVKQYPHRVQSLMLVGSTPKFVADRDWPYAMPLKTFTVFAKQFQAAPQATLKQFCALQVLHASSSKQTMQFLQQALTTDDPDAICWGLRWLREIDLRDACFEELMPILLLQGENDQLSSLKAAEQTVKVWKQIQLCKIAGAGHVPFLSHPQLFIEQVRFMHSQIKTKANVK